MGNDLQNAQCATKRVGTRHWEASGGWACETNFRYTNDNVIYSVLGGACAQTLRENCPVFRALQKPSPSANCPNSSKRSSTYRGPQRHDKYPGERGLPGSGLHRRCCWRRADMFHRKQRANKIFGSCFVHRPDLRTRFAIVRQLHQAITLAHSDLRGATRTTTGARKLHVLSAIVFACFSLILIVYRAH
jgi:hypothetical protein